MDASAFRKSVKLIVGVRNMCDSMTIKFDVEKLFLTIRVLAQVRSELYLV